jgi:hypothetical protein
VITVGGIDRALDRFIRDKKAAQMTRETPPLSSVEVNQLQSTLLKCRVSLLGAQQFTSGQMVTNPDDRLALANLMHQLVRRGPGTSMQFGTYDPVEH